MEVVFHRRSTQGDHTVEVERDGIVFSMNPYTYKGLVPHDMGHFVGEDALNIDDGIWGSIAAGAIYQSMTVVRGRLRHDARKRSAEVLRASTASGGFRLGETVPAVLIRAVEEGLDVRAATKDVGRLWEAARSTPTRWDHVDVARAIEAFRRAGQRWQATPVGGELVLRWSRSHRQNRRRASRG